MIIYEEIDPMPELKTICSQGQEITYSQGKHSKCCLSKPTY